MQTIQVASRVAFKPALGAILCLMLAVFLVSGARYVSCTTIPTEARRCLKKIGPTPSNTPHTRPAHSNLRLPWRSETQADGSGGESRSRSAGIRPECVVATYDRIGAQALGSL